MSDERIAARLKRAGVSRRDFMGFCGKLMVAAPFGLAITDFLTPEAVAQALCMQTSDFKEAHAAFIEKRPAKFG